MRSDHNQLKTDRSGEVLGATSIPRNPLAAPDGARVVRLASRLLDAPISLLLAIEDDRVVIMAARGLDELSPVTIPFNPELIADLFDQPGDTVVHDDGGAAIARALGVIAGADARAVLGVPIRPPDGARRALLVALDTRPRRWSDDDLTALSDLAALSEPQPATDQLAGHTELLESIGDGVYSVDLNGICRYINRTGAELLGYEPEEIVGRPIHDLIQHSYPDGTPMSDEERPTGAAIRSGSRTVVCTQYFWRRDGSSLPVELTVAPITEQGELTGAVVSFSDISQRLRREADIRFYKHIVDSIGESVVVADPDRRVVYANRAAESQFGWSLEEVRGQDVRDLVPDERYREGTSRIGAEARATGEPRSGEFLLRRTDGSRFPALFTLTPVKGATDDRLSTIGVYTDISDLKQTEDELRFHKHIVDAVGQAVIANDNSPERRITYWNDAAEHLLGWSADEAIGRGFYETVPAEDFWPEVQEIDKLARAGEPWQGDFRMRHRAGTIIPAIASVAPILDNDGEVLGVISVYTDMTEVKETERQIRLYKHLLDSTGQALVSNHLDRTITYWNRAAEQMLGWTADEVLGRDFYEVAPAEDALDEIRQIGAQIRRGGSWAGEFKLKRKDGSTLPVLMSVSPVIDDDGNPVQVVGAYTDISDLKETEQEIRFYKHVVEAVGQVIIANDLDRNITYWNRTAEEVLGWKSEEVVGRDAATIAPTGEFLPNIPGITEVVRSGNTWTGEFLMKHRDGTTIPALSTIKPIFDEDNNLIGVLGAHTDIRELKNTERELRIHKDMLDAVGQAVLATDASLRITYWNRAAAELYGYHPDEALGMYLPDLMPVGNESFYRAASTTGALWSEDGWTGEMTAYGKDGSEIAVLTSVTPTLSDDDAQAGLIVAMADITQRRQTEEALRESSQQIIQILETMGDGFVSVDHEWNLTYVNRRAERLLGRSREMVLGGNLWDEFPGADQRAFYQEYSHAMTTGEAVDFTEYYPELGAWFEVHAFGSGDQLSIFFRDVTERITQETALREAEQRYRTLVEQVPALTYVASADDDTDIRYVSPQIQSLMGYTSEEWLRDSRFWLSRVHPEDRPFVIHKSERADATRERYTLEYRQRTRDGEYRWIRDTATLIRDEDGAPRYWQGIAFDISDEKAAERKVHASEQRFRSLFEHNPDAVFSIDRSGHVLTANPAFIQFTGADPQEQGAFRFVDLVVPEDHDRVNAHFDKSHQGESQAFHASITNRRDGHIALSITTIPITIDGEIVGVHVVAQDVTLHQKLEKQLAHQAYHDALTGLPNRNRFQNRLVNRIDQSIHDGSRFAVLFFDLDDFKVINDSLGHSAGDTLLVLVAERVQDCIRDDDLLARLSGDEFTILLERISDECEAIVIAERIAEVLDESFMVDGHEVFVTTSVGIAIVDQHSDNADDVLRNADLAMYEAKNSGKNRYALFEPSMNSRAWLRLTLETELRRALDRDEFEVYYQPIVDLSTGGLDGVEALARWNHPVRGFLEPGEFIEVAEQSGLILPLGKRMIDQAVSELAQWQRLMPDRTPPRLSINLSSREYQHPSLVEDLAAAIERADADPKLLTMEISESVAMDRSEHVLSMLQRLKETGVKLALDDFGSGFSALSYLRRFPIDIIKIDQSFVEGLTTDPEDSSIVEAVMAASLAINLRVTAEGIETLEQLRALRQLGCHLGQGYLFSRALSASEMRQLLQAGTVPWRQRLLELSEYT